MRPLQRGVIGTAAVDSSGSTHRSRHGRFAAAESATVPKLAVKTRRQTPEEQRHYRTALELFLSEWVRQQLKSRARN